MVRVTQLEADEDKEETAKQAAAGRKLLENRGVGKFDLTIDRLLDDETLGMDINHRPNGPEKGGLADGWGIIHYAIHLGNEHRVDWLLEREDVDLNLPALQTGITPLMIASKEGRLDLVLKLIEAGVDVKQKDGALLRGSPAGAEAAVVRSTSDSLSALTLPTSTHRVTLSQ